MRISPDEETEMIGQSPGRECGGFLRGLPPITGESVYLGSQVQRQPSRRGELTQGCSAQRVPGGGHSSIQGMSPSIRAIENHGDAFLTEKRKSDRVAFDGPAPSTDEGL